MRQHAAALLDAMIADHERSTGRWEITWIALPEVFLLSSGALAQARVIVAGLEADPKRMRANIDPTRGLAASEAVMMGLAPSLGRQRAHELLDQLCRKAMEQQRPPLNVLAETLEVTRHVDREELSKLCDPVNYLGLSAVMGDGVLAALPG